jgi:ABC-type nitrate/sulfonate/bicarbonate transport system substrate-binding protein
MALKRNLYRLTRLDGSPHHVLDAPYETIEAALKAAKMWCTGQGLSCTIKDRGIGVQVLAGNGTWRTVCYPANCLQSSLA